MKPQTRALAPILALILAFPFTTRGAWAQDDCADAVATADMRTCMNARYAAAGADLERVYHQLLREVAPGRRELLQAAQQSWAEFREKNAAFAASAVEGGTLYPLLEVSELVTMTQQRTEQLKSYLE